jgi:release factor glutamine methyltransferase
MSRRVAELLACARDAGVDRLDAQLLLAHVLQRHRAWLIAHGDEVLSDDDAERSSGLIARRAAGEPLAYLVGEKEFRGLVLRVGPQVLVPRPDTETLVDWALALLAGPLAGIESPRVVDLGTGSGAIALALKQACPRADVTATDASEAALAVARDNGQRLNLPLRLRGGSWWAAVDGERFDLAVSNPPYIAEGDPHLPALRHEPAGALVSGADGLDAIREIVAGAAAHLHAGGWLLLEHGHDQAPAVTGLLLAGGWRSVQSKTDLSGVRRCTGAQRPR